MVEKIMNIITNYCENCQSVYECPEDVCPLWQIEQELIK